MRWQNQFYINGINVIAKKKGFFASHSLWIAWFSLEVLVWYHSNNSPQHLQQISCSMLSFHCNVSDVQGETDGMPNTVFPFARARRKAVRQLGPHVTTRAISNVACLYEHTTSTAGECGGWLSLVWVYSQRESAFYHELWFLRYEPITSCVSDVVDMDKADVV